MNVHLRSFILLSLASFIVPMYFVVSTGSGAFLTGRFNLFHYIDQSVWIFVLLLTAFCLGNLWVDLLIPRRVSKTTIQRTKGDWILYRRSSYVAWAASIFAILILLGGVPSTIISNVVALQTKVNDAVENQSLLFVFSTICLTCSFFVFFMSITCAGRASKIDYFIIVLTAVICIAIGSRYRGVLAIGGPVYLLYIRGHLKFRWVLFFSMIAAVTINILLAVRTAAQGVQGSLARYSFIEQFFAQWSIFDGFPVAVALSQTFPVTFGQAITNVTNWVLPEWIVGQKELVATMAARLLLFGDSLGGITIGVFGEAYYYFGYTVGTVYVFMLGTIMALLARKTSVQGLLGAVSVFLIANFLLGSLRNGFFSDLLAYYVILFTFVFCYLLGKVLGALAQPRALRV